MVVKVGRLNSGAGCRLMRWLQAVCNTIPSRFKTTAQGARLHNPPMCRATLLGLSPISGETTSVMPSYILLFVWCRLASSTLSAPAESQLPQPAHFPPLPFIELIWPSALLWHRAPADADLLSCLGCSSGANKSILLQTHIQCCHIL